MATIKYLGHLSLMEVFPIIMSARRQILAVVSLVRPSVKARLDGLLKLAASIKPPSISASVQLGIKLRDSLQVAIAPPSFAASACAQLSARLTAIIGALQAAVSWGIFPGFVHVFVYEGRADQMGATISAAIQGGLLSDISPQAMVYAPAIVVDATDPVAPPALKVILKTS